MDEGLAALRWRVAVAALWVSCAAAGAALWLFPAFARGFAAELFPVGCVTGWLAHSGIMARRGRG